MLDCVITVCAIFGLAFLIKESDGPWGIMAWLRNAVMQSKRFGVFFYKLLDCYFCLGFHCGWIVYLLHERAHNFEFFILWGLAGGVISLILNALLGKLSASHG